MAKQADTASIAKTTKNDDVSDKYKSTIHPSNPNQMYKSEIYRNIESEISSKIEEVEKSAAVNPDSKGPAGPIAFENEHTAKAMSKRSFTRRSPHAPHKDMVTLQRIPMPGLPEGFSAAGTLIPTMCYQDENGKVIEIDLQPVFVPPHILAAHLPPEFRPSKLPKTPDRAAQESTFMMELQKQIASIQEKQFKRYGDT